MRKNPFMVRQAHHERDEEMKIQILSLRPEPVEGRAAIFSHDRRLCGEFLFSDFVAALPRWVSAVKSSSP